MTIYRIWLSDNHTKNSSEDKLERKKNKDIKKYNKNIKRVENKIFNKEQMLKTKSERKYDEKRNTTRQKIKIDYLPEEYLHGDFDGVSGNVYRAHMKNERTKKRDDVKELKHGAKFVQGDRMVMIK